MAEADIPHRGEKDRYGALMRSDYYVLEVTRHEAKLVGSENVVLGGISQEWATAT